MPGSLKTRTDVSHGVLDRSVNLDPDEGSRRGECDSEPPWLDRRRQITTTSQD